MREGQRVREVEEEKGRRDHCFARGNSIFSTNGKLLRGCRQLPVSKGGGGKEWVMFCSHYTYAAVIIIILKPKHK